MKFLCNFIGCILCVPLPLHLLLILCGSLMFVMVCVQLQKWSVTGKLPYRVKTTLVGFWNGWLYFTSGQRDRGPDNPAPRKVIGQMWRTKLHFWQIDCLSNRVLAHCHQFFCLSVVDLFILFPLWKIACFSSYAFILLGGVREMRELKITVYGFLACNLCAN